MKVCIDDLDAVGTIKLWYLNEWGIFRKVEVTDYMRCGNAYNDDGELEDVYVHFELRGEFYISGTYNKLDDLYNLELIEVSISKFSDYKGDILQDIKFLSENNGWRKCSC